MKKWIVRWTVEGFNIREKFNTREEAMDYCNKILNSVEGLQELDVWEEK